MTFPTFSRKPVLEFHGNAARGEECLRPDSAILRTVIGPTLFREHQKTILHIRDTERAIIQSRKISYQ